MKNRNDRIQDIEERLRVASQEQAIINQTKRDIDKKVEELQSQYAALVLGRVPERPKETKEEDEDFLIPGAYVARVTRTPEEKASGRTYPGVVIRKKEKGRYLTFFVGKTGPGNYNPSSLQPCTKNEARPYERELKELSKHIRS